MQYNIRLSGCSHVLKKVNAVSSLGSERGDFNDRIKKQNFGK